MPKSYSSYLPNMLFPARVHAQLAKLTKITIKFPKPSHRGKASIKKEGAVWQESYSYSDTLVRIARQENDTGQEVNISKIKYLKNMVAVTKRHSIKK